MALSKLDQVWIQTPSPPRTTKSPLLCPGTLIPLSLPVPINLPLTLIMPQSLYCVIQEGNKANKYRPKDLWKFRVAGIEEVLGYMRDSICNEMIWTDNFHVDEKHRAITLTPRTQRGETPASACRRAFSDLCQRNQGRLNNCLDRWVSKPRQLRDFHPIHNTDAKWQDLSIPVPARGLFGIVTIGVHLNMYSVRKRNDGRKVIDRIWVSQRATGEHVSYPGMLDQIVAGGMDPTDHVGGLLSPGFTLMREAKEEAGLTLDLKTKAMTTTTASGRQVKIGTVKEAPTITFYDLKGRDAGRASEGHLEPGVRFVYDLELCDSKFRPEKQEKGIAKFESLSVDEVKARLRAKLWKPNCGLVMLDFLARKNLITKEDEEKYAEIKKELHRSLPFKFTEECYPFIAPWE
ncbi:hypothetical protein BGZ63DRAFT_375663 [Mariannaea sp. PMI_226]|nr:hypothetical protein BGZ63DRAFT_375663 [Mariannaea sp. PMI_226]